MTLSPAKIRNLAIIAHVDHGKTTLIDSLLNQSGIFRNNQSVAERVMDSNDLEKERGITILAKCTAVDWQSTRINIVDTPGHADFGGEVERVLSMVDGVILLVDASEGPMPQTKFVLGKALKQGLQPIVIVNKIDKTDARPQEVVDEILELFIALNAEEAQLDFPVLYASGRAGWCVEQLDQERKNLAPLLNLIVNYVHAPRVEVTAPFSMLVTLLSSDPFLGRILTGRITSGKAELNNTIKAIDLHGKTVENGRLTKLLAFDGIKMNPVKEAIAGDIIAVAGLEKVGVADTIAAPEVNTPIAALPIDPPTMSITLSVNDSPMAGRDGKKLTSRVIRDRLLAEAATNVAIEVNEAENKDAFAVNGRGELQLGVLVETMRREGFELSVSRPRVLFLKDQQTGKLTEPIEELIVDVDDPYTGIVIEKLNGRKGELQDMQPTGGGKTRLVFLVPSRGLIGYQSEFLTDTKGTGVINKVYHSHADYKGTFASRRNGVLIANGPGQAVAYALFNLQERGILFVEPQDIVYEGMIVGEHSRENDLEVNVLKGKKLTNVRAAGSDENVKLTPPRHLTLEMMMSYIAEDELVEVTPKHLRLRKKILNASDRKRAVREKKEI